MVSDMNHGSSMKCLSFKLSRVRFVNEPEALSQDFVVTGSWMEEVNRLCLWQYGIGDAIDKSHIIPISEDEDYATAGVLGDSADDPRLLYSIVHPGSVQDLKIHHSTKRIYSASSNGSLHVCSVNFSSISTGHPKLSRLTSSDWMPFGKQTIPGGWNVALASLALSPDGNQVYVASDLGQMAVIPLDRIPTWTDKVQPAVDTKDPYDVVLMAGSDVATVNALEQVDNSTLSSVNQLGQLKLWDLRVGLHKPQKRLLRPGEAQPLLCLNRHPGQSYLLAVGGVRNSSSIAYIWDLRADQYPLTEIGCDGQTVWEIKFHPRQPKHLFIATEPTGLLKISCRDDSDSWTGFKGSRGKLVVSSALPESNSLSGVISFDVSNTQLICGHSEAILQTIPCQVSVY